MANLDAEFLRPLIDLHPIGRLGRPEETADAALFLLSDEASFVTGALPLVDGGFTGGASQPRGRRVRRKAFGRKGCAMRQSDGRKVTIVENGPYLVGGDVPLANQHIVTNQEGESLEWREGEALTHPKEYALCRCGRSASKPYCDGTHKKVAFDGTETASRAPYRTQAGRIEGPTMVLDDAEDLCAFARFCDPKGRVWNLVERTDEPAARKLVEHEAGHCPAGRLIARDRATGKAFEPRFEPSIGLVQDTARRISGPIWVRGGIPVVGADGVEYEVRNRVTLCRCGASSNKPFCDGTHASIGFKDGNERT